MNIRDIFTRKNLLIVGFVLFVFILGFLLYVVFFRSTTTPPTPGGDTATSTPGGIGGLPGAGDGDGRPDVVDLLPGELPDAIARGGITQTDRLTNSSVTNVTRGTGNTLSYYDEFSGQFYTLDSNGNIRALSDQTFPRVDNVAWSRTGNKAIIEFPDGANIFYNFEEDTQVTLPRHWTDFGYSPATDQIIFKSLGLEPENNFLTISDEQGNGATIIEYLGDSADIVNPSWSPANQIVANYAEPLDSGRSEVYMIGQNDENFKSLVVNGYNFDSMWNPNGSQLLYEVTSASTNNNPSLWIVNAQGANIGSGRRPLNIQTTIDKCVFQDTTTLYCAVPQFLPENSGLMPVIGEGIADDLYKINVVTGSSSLLAKLDVPLPVTNLVVSDDNRYLYFTDEVSGALRKIQLR